MDINKYSFPYSLPHILSAIADATFISLDLEFSGVSNNKTRGGRPGEPEAGRPTLQDRYQETKEAGERFQIMQVGLTCVMEDANNSRRYCSFSPYT